MPTNKNQNNKKRTKINPVKAGLAGTAIVAAGVAAVALSSKGNRKKAGKVLKNLQAKSKKLSKRASVGLEKVLKDEEVLRGAATTALSTVKKVARSAPKPGKVRKNVVKAVKLNASKAAKSGTKSSAKAKTTGRKSTSKTKRK